MKARFSVLRVQHFVRVIMLTFLGLSGVSRSDQVEDAVRAEETKPIGVGSLVPSVQTRTAAGRPVDLVALVRDRPTVLLFYRGGWCPYCSRHLKEMQGIEGDLRKLGYQIVAISPDRPEKVAAVAQQQGIGYTLVSDSKMNAARAFGLSFTVDAATKAKYSEHGIDLENASGEAHGLLPVPAAFIVDSRGRIRYTYANPDYKVRVKGPQVLAAAKEALSRDVSIYDFSVLDAGGQPVGLSEHRGKVLLIVNTASRCGFTRQYAGLEKLHEKYRDRGFSVLAFPCNQFGGQEPGTNTEIQAFCTGKFGVTFPVYGKIDVNGKGADPLYVYLKAQAPGAGGTQSIKWNFTKFLVGNDGSVRKRYGSRTQPEQLDEAIAELLAEGQGQQ